MDTAYSAAGLPFQQALSVLGTVISVNSGNPTDSSTGGEPWARRTPSSGAAHPLQRVCGAHTRCAVGSSLIPSGW